MDNMWVRYVVDVDVDVVDVDVVHVISMLKMLMLSTLFCRWPLCLLLCLRLGTLRQQAAMRDNMEKSWFSGAVLYKTSKNPQSQAMFGE